MKKRYYDLMKMAPEAYSTEEIIAFFDKNKKEGLTEHGHYRLFEATDKGTVTVKITIDRENG